MNIIQIHERVRFWLDSVGSARFDTFDIDIALNTSMNKLIEDRYEESRMNRGDSFQQTQKVRDELSNIVKKVEITTTNSTGISLVPIADIPAGYNYLLALGIKGTITYPCTPTTYDLLNTLQSNPYRRVRQKLFPKIYYIESNEGITVHHIMPGITKAVLHYLTSAVQWRYGIDYTSSKSFTVGDKVIVNSDIVTYNGVTYYRGDQITIVTGHLSITLGTVNFDYVSSDINANLHEEIARMAAVHALISIREVDKAKILIEYNM